MFRAEAEENFRIVLNAALGGAAAAGEQRDEGEAEKEDVFHDE